MKKYDLKTEKGQKAYFKDRQAILKQYDVEIKKDWHGEEATFDTGYVQLDGITAECLQKLIDSGFADSNDTQNGDACKTTQKEGKIEKRVKRYSEQFAQFLTFIDFELVRVQEIPETLWKLRDLQGANLGGIESDRFHNASEIVDRLDVYINDYILKDEEWGNFDSLTDILKKSPQHPLIETVDLLVNHTEEVDLNQVYALGQDIVAADKTAKVIWLVYVNDVKTDVCDTVEEAVTAADKRVAAGEAARENVRVYKAERIK